MNFSFSTHSIRSHPRRQAIETILSSALRAVDPHIAVTNAMSLSGDTLYVVGKALHLNNYRNVHVVAFGKASLPMAAASAEILSSHLDSSLAITKDGYAHNAQFTLPHQFSIVTSAHPVPADSSISAGRSILSLLSNAAPNDLIIFLISGGGSSLVTLPPAGITLADIQQLTRLLLASGATIDEINILRKHLDVVKGGGLLKAVGNASTITLILSDVIGDPVDAIASGPTVPDPSTFADALGVLADYKILADTPLPILDHLRKGMNRLIPETLKPDQMDPQRHPVEIIASNRIALHAARDVAINQGFSTSIITERLDGEASQKGTQLSGILAKQLQQGTPDLPFCLLAGGETTVTIRGNGLGGRNQEMALAGVQSLSGQKDCMMICLATDGNDGPTDAAGAVVTNTTLHRAKSLGLDPSDFLHNNDSYHFFAPLEDLLTTGPTHTNVNDLVFLFGF